MTVADFAADTSEGAEVTGTPVPIAIDDTALGSPVSGDPASAHTQTFPAVQAPVLEDAELPSPPPNFFDPASELVGAIGSTLATEPSSQELVTCPECGTVAMITLNKREARDFCRNCDFPLFWTPSAIQREADGSTAAETLRRLPGTGGRATVASVPCPHCAEPNAITAAFCSRCGQSMIVVAPPPVPEPVYVPPPPVVVAEPEPEKSVPWWVWALIGAGFLITVTLIILAVAGVFS